MAIILLHVLPKSLGLLKQKLSGSIILSYVQSDVNCWKHR